MGKESEIAKEHDEKTSNLIYERFKNYIDKSLLNKTIDAIIQDGRINTIQKNGDYIFYECKSGILSDIDYDIAVNCAMTNWYYSFGGDHINNAYNSKNKRYIETLTNQYFENADLRHFLSLEERISNFIHVPIIYVETCLCEFLKGKFTNYIVNRNNGTGINQKDIFWFNSLSGCVTTLCSLLHLLSEWDFSNANALLRTTLETFFVFADLSDNSRAIAEYYIFLDYKKTYEKTNIYPLDFDNKYNNRKHKDASKRSFLDYGWLDILINDGSDAENYNFAGVIDVYEKQNKNNPATLIRELYAECSPFSHGDLLSYKTAWFPICTRGYYISILLPVICKYIIKFLKFDSNEAKELEKLLLYLRGESETLRDKLIPKYKSNNKP